MLIGNTEVVTKFGRAGHPFYFVLSLITKFFLFSSMKRHCTSKASCNHPIRSAVGRKGQTPFTVLRPRGNNRNLQSIPPDPVLRICADNVTSVCRSFWSSAARHVPLHRILCSLHVERASTCLNEIRIFTIPNLFHFSQILRAIEEPTHLSSRILRAMLDYMSKYVRVFIQKALLCVSQARIYD